MIFATTFFHPTLAYHFQENLLRTMIQIENTYFELGKSCSKNCLIICDRGVMDASACKGGNRVKIEEMNINTSILHFLSSFRYFKR